MSSICQEKHDYADFEKKIIDTLNKNAPKKIKTFRGNQKPHINKPLRKAIMKRSQHKNKASKTRNAIDFLNYKKQRNYVVKLNNQFKKDHFDRLNTEKDSKPFWKSCKPYFSNKIFFGNSKIALSENGEFLTENNKIEKTFNSLFLRQPLIHLIYLVGPQKLMSVMIRFKKSYTIFQTTLLFLKSRKKFNLTKDFLSSMFLRLPLEKL